MLNRLECLGGSKYLDYKIAYDSISMRLRIFSWVAFRGE
jgi:hypothetical protein